MEYTLLDTIKSTSGIRNETGLIKYQSLPQGVKELSYRRDWLFFKNWWIVFEGALDLRKLEVTCKENNYSLIAEEPVKLPPLMEETRGFDKKLDEITAVFEASKPDRRYYVYRGDKELVCINCYEQSKKIYFCTSQRKGLKLAEDYRRSLIKR